MKRLVSFALILLAAVAPVLGAQLTATLQHGDKVTAFYGADAFKQAYAAADSADIITLSPGNFDAVEIAKSVTVIGTYAFSTDDSKTTRFVTLTVSGKHITLEGIRFTTELKVNGTESLTVRRCHMPLISDINNLYHHNTNIEDSFIERFDAMYLSKNAVIRNCYIGYFWDCNSSANLALIEHCNVNLFYKYYDTNYEQPYAIYRNNFLVLYQYSSTTNTPKITFYAPSEFHNNIFARYSQYKSGLSYCKPVETDWGSCANSGNTYVTGYEYETIEKFPYYEKFDCGGTYGPVNHKEYPAIPAITSAVIDTNTDADGNLKVKISATARD